MSADLARMAAATACVLAALIFLRAALHKAGDAGRFEGVLADYGLAPEGALRALARIVPAAEFAAAAALALEPSRMAGAGAGAGLLVAYAAAMGVNLARGRTEIDCGCGGAPEPLSWALVVRNLVLAGCLAPAAFGLAAPAGWGQVMSAWGVGLVAFLVWGGMEQLSANARRMRLDARLAAGAGLGGAA